MFHQPNLRAFACADSGSGCPTGATGQYSLLGLLLDLTFAKYQALVNLPILSPKMDEIGTLMAERMQYNKAGVRAHIVGQTLTVTVTKAATVPVTGLNATGAESYGGQFTSRIKLSAGQTATFTVQ